MSHSFIFSIVVGIFSTSFSEDSFVIAHRALSLNRLHFYRNSFILIIFLNIGASLLLQIDSSNSYGVIHYSCSDGYHLTRAEKSLT
jgi:hypothetical protein